MDTVVVSELRKARPHPRVVGWVRSQREGDLYLSVITLGEIERGIAKAVDAEFAKSLARWLEGLIRVYGDRFLPVTAEISRRWGRWSAEFGKDGIDLLLAATAAAHGLTLATRDVGRFAPTGVPVLDPFRSAA